MSVEEFAIGLALPSESGMSKVDSMVKFSQDAQGIEQFEDDYSLVEICFK